MFESVEQCIFWKYVYPSTSEANTLCVVASSLVEHLFSPFLLLSLKGFVGIHFFIFSGK